MTNELLDLFSHINTVYLEGMHQGKLSPDILDLIRAARQVPFPSVDCPSDCTCYQSQIWKALGKFKEINL